MAVGLSQDPLYAIEPQHTPQAIPQSAASLRVVGGGVIRCILALPAELVCNLARRLTSVAIMDRRFAGATSLLDGQLIVDGVCAFSGPRGGEDGVDLRLACHRTR